MDGRTTVKYLQSYIKEKDYRATKIGIYQILIDLYDKHRFLLEGDLLSENDFIIIS